MFHYLHGYFCCDVLRVLCERGLKCHETVCLTVLWLFRDFYLLWPRRFRKTLNTWKKIVSQIKSAFRCEAQAVEHSVATFPADSSKNKHRALWEHFNNHVFLYDRTRICDCCINPRLILWLIKTMVQSRVLVSYLSHQSLSECVWFWCLWNPIFLYSALSPETTCGWLHRLR